MRSAFFISLLLLEFGCADVPTESQREQLIGTWYAITVEYQRQDDPDQRLDVLTLGPEWLWELTVRPDYTHTVELCNPLGCDQVTGTVSLVGDSLVLSDDSDFEDYVRGEVSLREGRLHIRWASAVACGLFDWEGPPCPIAVHIEIHAERRP